SRSRGSRRQQLREVPPRRDARHQRSRSRSIGGRGRRDDRDFERREDRRDDRRDDERERDRFGEAAGDGRERLTLRPAEELSPPAPAAEEE
ncbi:unnamed protein product, partial [Polarella glacialis]